MLHRLPLHREIATHSLGKAQYLAGRSSKYCRYASVVSQFIAINCARVVLTTRVRPMHVAVSTAVAIRLAPLLAQLKDLPQFVPIRVMLDG